MARGSVFAGVLGAGGVTSALVAGYVLGVYLPSLNTPHTSLEGVPHERSALPTGPGLSRRLAVVVIDGLSYDAARTLDGLWPLRRRGVFRSLAVEFPTYTSPALVSFVTGLGPRDSGTRRNGDLGGVKGLDSVLLAAHDARVPLTLFSRAFGDFAAIMAPPAGTPVYAGWFAPAVDMARRSLAGGVEPPAFDGKSAIRTLDLIHWGEVDETGHRHGAASPQYREESANAAAYLVHYARTLDLEQDDLVIVSDHGHVPEGGHGGDEPAVSHGFFLALGGLFRRGVELGERPMRDVASTLSVVGGLHTPSSNLGLPMLDALALDDQQAAFLLAEPFDEATRFLCRVRPAPGCAGVEALVARLEKADPTAPEEAEALHADLMGARARDLDDRRTRHAWIRLGGAALLLGLAAAVTRRLGRGVRLADGLRWPALGAPLVLAAAYTTALALGGYRATFSHVPPMPVVVRNATEAGLLALAATAAFAWVARPGRYAPWVLLSAITVPFVLLAAWVGADPAGVPPNVAGVLVFLLGPLVLTAAVAAPGLAWMEGRRGGS